jgi:threonine dehydrogenase-like Zn-dependent dehydrogenase
MVIEDVPDSGPARAGNVIVRPEAVGICGSDFHLFSGDVGALSGLRDFYPRIQGHEVSAVVQDPGDCDHVTAGERVAIWPLLPCGSCYPCRIGRPNVCVSFRLVGVHLDGGLAERLEVPADVVFGVGDLDPDSTAFVEPASVVVHVLARGRLQPGEQVVVFGAGPIGLATVLAAAGAGAQVLSIDPVAGRRDLATWLGAECVAWAPPAELLEEIDVIGSSCATAEDFRNAVRLVSAHSASLTALFSHHFPLDHAAEAFEFAMRRPQDAIKVVVTVN